MDEERTHLHFTNTYLHQDISEQNIAKVNKDHYSSAPVPSFKKEMDAAEFEFKPLRMKGESTEVKVEDDDSVLNCDSATASESPSLHNSNADLVDQNDDDGIQEEDTYSLKTAPHTSSIDFAGSLNPIESYIGIDYGGECSMVLSGGVDLVRETQRGSKTQHKCNICFKVCTTPSELKIHQRVHSGEKPYCCEVCSKSFAQAGGLKLHQRTHTGETPYKCDVCEKGFKDSSGLNAHKRTHTKEKPYVCDVCDKAFSLSNNLVRHKRTHSWELPYKCDVCPKAFRESSTLTSHKLVHSNLRAFKCDLCPQTFKRSSSLNRHLKNMH